MSALHTVVLSAEAGSNIKEAWHWIAESDPEAADRWYDGLIAALETLAKLPQRHPISSETCLGLIDTEIHQLLYGHGYWKYRFLFAVEENKVLIAHVRHGARLYLGQEKSK